MGPLPWSEGAAGSRVSGRPAACACRWGGRKSLSQEDKDQLGSLCRFRADFYFPLWWRSRFRTALQHNTVPSMEEMKPFKWSGLHVAASPAAFKLTEAFCSGPRNVYLIEQALFCGHCKRTPRAGEKRPASDPLLKSDGSLFQEHREIHPRTRHPPAPGLSRKRQSERHKIPQTSTKRSGVCE